MKSWSGLPPGLDPELVEQEKVATATANLSKAAKKNLKRKEKKKQQKDGGAEETKVDMVTDSLEKATITGKQSQSKTSSTSKSADGSQSLADPTKKLKNLKKKLRQIDDLQAKVDSGEVVVPSKEQLEKLARREALAEEIEDLELDLDD